MYRKVAYSHKQKKEQLRVRRLRKESKPTAEDFDIDDVATLASIQSRMNVTLGVSGKPGQNTNLQIVNINEQPVDSSAKYNPNRYRLHVQADSNLTSKEREALARQPFTMLSEEAFELDVEACYDPDLSSVSSSTDGRKDSSSQEAGKPRSLKLDMPKRPLWDYKISAEELNQREQKYFKDYVEKVMRGAEEAERELSYFELNLETWRQLWRVVEMSDLILLIADIRYPALYFSPSLYHHVTSELHKNMVLILNKIDLAPAPLVAAWMDYFQLKFPQLRVVCFTSFPLEESDSRGSEAVLHKEQRKCRKSTLAVGPKQLLKVCEEIVGSNVDLSGWRDKIEEDSRDAGGREGTAHEDDEDEEGELKVRAGEIKEEVLSTDYQQHEMYKDGILTIGCCGYPNVGKSSLINGLMGKKVVSVSRTPGHTKHFQTIFLTSNVKLCDSPGLVFPSYVCRPLQVLSGMYPVAQVRDPYSALRYLAERVDLPQLLRLKHPTSTDDLEEYEKEKRRIAAACTVRSTATAASATRGSRPNAAGPTVRCSAAAASTAESSLIRAAASNASSVGADATCTTTISASSTASGAATSTTATITPDTVTSTTISAAVTSSRGSSSAAGNTTTTVTTSEAESTCAAGTTYTSASAAASAITTVAAVATSAATDSTAAASLPWSAYHICDAWAEKRGYKTAKRSWNDVYRAGNQLLRLATETRICLCLRPPGYTARKDEWERSDVTEEIRSLQALHRDTTHFSDESLSNGEEEEDDVRHDDDDDDTGDDDTVDDKHSTRISNKFALLTTDND